MKKKEHILVIRLSAMGDIAMVAPVVYAFAKANPSIKISVLSKPFFRPIIKAIPGVHFIAAEVMTTHKGVSGMWKLSRLLKRHKITAIADLHNVLRSKMLLTFLGLPTVKIDKGRSEKKQLIGGRKEHFKQLKTSIDRYATVFEKMGYTLPVPETLPKPERSSKTIEITQGCRKKWLGIAPFAAHYGKQYPLDAMQEVIKGLDNSGDWDIYLFGSPDEQQTLRDISFDCVDVHVIAGTLSFEQEINLIAQLDVMLSMDSGNGHLAAMYGVKTITLWGVTHPYAGFAPFNMKQHCILSDREQYPKIPTSIYGNVTPEGYEDVMKTITPAMVIDKVQSLL